MTTGIGSGSGADGVGDALLVFAAPLSFFSLAAMPQDLPASFSHSVNVSLAA